MSYTNMSDLSNITSFSDLLNQANTTTSGTFWTGMYWMVITIIFLSSATFGWEVAIMMALFAGFIIGIFGVYLGLIGMTTVGMTEAILLFLTIYLMYSSNRNPQ